MSYHLFAFHNIGAGGMGAGRAAAPLEFFSLSWTIFSSLALGFYY